jgi:hypothetical protein
VRGPIDRKSCLTIWFFFASLLRLVIGSIFGLILYAKGSDLWATMASFGDEDGEKYLLAVLRLHFQFLS